MCVFNDTHNTLKTITFPSEGNIYVRHLLFYLLLVMTTPPEETYTKISVVCVTAAMNACVPSEPRCLSNNYEKTSRETTREGLNVALTDTFPYCYQHDTCSGSSAAVSVTSARRWVTLWDRNCSLLRYDCSHRRSLQLKCFFPLHKTYKPTHTELFYVIQD